jgi:hypothetical protein
MSNNNLWFGYLDAGEKSSPVVMDTRLNTANPNTVYLFNLRRAEIIEYRRDIIEPKLRPLNGGDGENEKTLSSAYIKVRSDFSPRGGRLGAIPEKGTTRAAAPKKPHALDAGGRDEAFEALIGEGGDGWDEED